jgi:hypothetical protein
MFPESRLEYKERFSREVRFPTEGGIEEVKKLVPALKFVRRVRAPMSFGITPLNWFDSKSIP